MAKNNFLKSRALKIILASVIVAAIITAALCAIRFALNKNKISDAAYIVRKEVYENSVSVAGVVSAAQEQTLQALSDGTVIAVYVKQGDAVKKKRRDYPNGCE